MASDPFEGIKKWKCPLCENVSLEGDCIVMKCPRCKTALGMTATGIGLVCSCILVAVLGAILAAKFYMPATKPVEKNMRGNSVRQ